jgi:hypothetical protein
MRGGKVALLRGRLRLKLRHSGDKIWLPIECINEERPTGYA